MSAPREIGTVPGSVASATGEGGAPVAGAAALRFSGVTKLYPGVRALSDVSLEVRPGEVHGLVGENGAGKSTLMGIGAGSVVADEGTVEIGGRLLDRASPDLARELGLAIVYQEPALMPDLTVAENIAIATSKQRRPGWWSASGFAAAALEAWGGAERIDPALCVRDLGPDSRFIVEISKALAQQPSVLLLDEPTEHLAADDVELLFEQIRRLSSQGTAIVYISHRIPEVLSICDRVSVLRDGVMQGMLERNEATQEKIVARIVGRSLETEFPPKRPAERPLGEAVLEATDLRGDGFSGIDLKIYPGEIVGLAGIEGSGQRDLARTLAGLAPARGELRVGDRKVRLGAGPAAAGAGIAFIPDDRHREGLFATLGVRENIAVGNLRRYSKSGVMRRSREREAIFARISELGVKTPSLDTRIASLSGGNQQKSVLGRTLERRPKVIVADEPTQGVDVGARLEIYRHLRAAVREDSCALVVASDGAELEGLCDRVLVLSRGHVVRELVGAEVTEQKMTEAALTATTSRAAETTVRSQSPFLRFLRGDLAPPAVVLAAAVALGAYITTQSDFYLTGTAFTGILTLFAALALASLAQQMVMIAGGIDLSVGPLMGFLVVVASFVIVPGKSQPLLILGWLLLVAIALSVGFVNWFPTLIDVPPFLTTLVTFTGLQGLSLLLRKTVGGEINIDVIESLTAKIGFVPWVAILAVVLGLSLELVLRRTTWGVRLRGVGSSVTHAHAIGIRTRLIQLSSYLVAGLLVFLASLVLMSQVGAGDPTAGINYTLISITAVVLGGASIFGGRGAFFGALAGAFLIQQINSAVSFLSLDTAWQTYLLGILTLVSAGLYSRARDIRVRA